jgi:hypothetical protein
MAENNLRKHELERKNSKDKNNGVFFTEYE